MIVPPKIQANSPSSEYLNDATITSSLEPRPSKSKSGPVIKKNKNNEVYQYVKITFFYVILPHLNQIVEWIIH